MSFTNLIQLNQTKNIQLFRVIYLLSSSSVTVPEESNDEERESSAPPKKSTSSCASSGLKDSGRKSKGAGSWASSLVMRHMARPASFGGLGPNGGLGDFSALSEDQ